jgi:Co/Zn/Cd efflux system component
MVRPRVRATSLNEALKLWQHRGDDINMRLAWLCSRNDVIANVGVLVAALAVRVTGSPWPDIAIGFLIAAFFGQSAIAVIREVISHYKPGL